MVGQIKLTTEAVNLRGADRSVNSTHIDIQLCTGCEKVHCSRGPCASKVACQSAE